MTDVEFITEMYEKTYGINARKELRSLIEELELVLDDDAWQ